MMTIARVDFIRAPPRGLIIASAGIDLYIPVDFNLDSV
jgi:hypothetical protein